MLVKRGGDSITSESYSFLRTNLEYLSCNKNLKTILVTSSDVDDGKTTIVGNLSLSLAKNEKKVILIDCNLRKPSVYKYFNIENQWGVSEIIKGEISIEDSIKEISKDLYVITSGKIPNNPSELISSKSMENLIKDLREIYDYVIIDASPILVFADSQILSTKVDGTILVIRSEKTTKDNAIKAKVILDKVDANVIGVVLNGVKDKKEKHHYYKLQSKAIKEVKKVKKRFKLDLN